MEANLDNQPVKEPDEAFAPPHLAPEGALWAQITTPRVLLLLVLKVVVLLALAMASVFVMDEFVQLGWAKYLGNGLFEDMWPVKAVGYAVFYMPAHILGWDAVSTVLIGRGMTVVLALATIAIVFKCARALQHSHLEALLVILVLLSFSNFIERIFRTRAEPLAVLFAAASLLVIVDGGPSKKRSFAAGILTGLAFVTTQKAIFFNVALGVAIVLDALFRRNVKQAVTLGSLLVCGWLVPVTVYTFAFGGADPLPVLQNLFFGPMSLVSEVPSYYSDMGDYLVDTFARNAFLYAVCFLGVCHATFKMCNLDSPSRIALIFTIIISLLIYTHNQPWPYIFVMALPFLSLWITHLIRATSSPGWPRNLVGVLIVGGVIQGLFLNANYLLNHGNSEQLALLRKAEQLTGSNDRYFDGVGMLPNRQEPSALWLDRPIVVKSLNEGAASELYHVFANKPPQTVIWSYRMQAVEPVLSDLLDRSYVKVAPNLLINGSRLVKGKPSDFLPVKPGQYTLYSDVGEPLQATMRLDGELVKAPVVLEASTVRLELIGPDESAILVREGDYKAVFDAQSPNAAIFEGVYD